MNENPYKSPAEVPSGLLLANKRSRWSTPVWFDWLLVAIMFALLGALYLRDIL